VLQKRGSSLCGLIKSCVRARVRFTSV